MREPKPFWTYAARVQKAGAVPCTSGEHIMLGLVEALIGRMAEALETVGRDLERLSRDVFRHKSQQAKPSESRDFQAIIEQLGAQGRSAGDDPRKPRQPEPPAGLSHDHGTRPSRGPTRMPRSG